MQPQDFFQRITKENLREAKEKKEKLSKLYWTMDVDNVYRAYHDSWKIFNIQPLIIKYLEALLALIGEDIPANTKILIKKLKQLRFEPRFIQLIDEALKIKFHGGAIPTTEWKSLFTAFYHVKISLDSCIRLVGDLLDGRLPGWRLGALEYYEALAIYIFGLDEWRYSVSLDKVARAKILQNGSPDIKKAHEQYIKKVAKEAQKVRKKIIKKKMISSSEWHSYRSCLPQAKVFRRCFATIEFQGKDGSRWINHIRLLLPDRTSKKIEKELSQRAKQSGFLFDGKKWIKTILITEASDIEKKMPFVSRDMTTILKNRQGVILVY